MKKFILILTLIMGTSAITFAQQQGAKEDQSQPDSVMIKGLSLKEAYYTWFEKTDLAVADLYPYTRKGFRLLNSALKEMYLENKVELSAAQSRKINQVGLIADDLEDEWAPLQTANVQNGFNLVAELFTDLDRATSFQQPVDKIALFRTKIGSFDPAGTLVEQGKTVYDAFYIAKQILHSFEEEMNADKM